MKYLSTIVLGFIPDSIIAYTIIQFFDEKSLKNFIYVFFGLQLFYLVRWIFESIVGWINFQIHKKEVINKIYKTLKEKNFPEPQEYHFDEKFPESYYREIGSDNNLEEDIKMCSLIFDTEITTMRSQGLLQPLFRLLKTHSEAIKKYQNDFNIND